MRILKAVFRNAEGDNTISQTLYTQYTSSERIQKETGTYGNVPSYIYVIGEPLHKDKEPLTKNFNFNLMIFFSKTELHPSGTPVTNSRWRNLHVFKISIKDQNWS